jgi:hypothetical protein
MSFGAQNTLHRILHDSLQMRLLQLHLNYLKLTSNVRYYKRAVTQLVHPEDRWAAEAAEDPEDGLLALTSLQPGCSCKELVHSRQVESLDIYYRQGPRSFHVLVIHLKYILILSSRVHPGLTSGFSHAGFPTKILNVFLISSTRATCPANLSLFISSP